MHWVPENLATASTRWWQETYQHHCEALEQKIQTCLAKAKETKTGCLELGSEKAPAQFQWRGHKLRTYQLVAWGRAKDIPIKGRVVRHLCNNLRVSTQRTSRSAVRQRTLRISGSYEHETPCSPPHIKNSSCRLAASVSHHAGKVSKT